MGLTESFRRALETDAKYFVMWGAAMMALWVAALGLSAWYIAEVVRFGALSSEKEVLLRFVGWPIGIGMAISFVASAFEFLRRVYQVRTYFVAKGSLQFANWSATLLTFAVPVVNFFVPWNRLDTIRETQRRYLSSGQCAVAHSRPNRARALGIIWGINTLFTVSGVSDDPGVMTVFLAGTTIEFALALASYLLAVRWLAELMADFGQITAPS